MGPGGVVVIDTKNWSGRVDVKDGVLRQNGFRRDRECTAAVEASAAVAAWMEPRHRSLVYPLLCLVGQSTPTAQPAALGVVGIDALQPTLRSWPARLSHEDVEAIATYLERLLDDTRSPAQPSANALEGVAAPQVREDSHAVRQAVARARATTSPGGPTATRRGLQVSSTRARRSRSGSSLRRDVARVAVVVVALLIGVHWLPNLAAGVGEQVQRSVPQQTVTPTPPPGHASDQPTAKSAAKRTPGPGARATTPGAAKS